MLSQNKAAESKSGNDFAFRRLVFGSSAPLA